MSDGTTNNWLRNLVAQHPALVISAIYLLASLIGMMFSWAYLREFGINVFRYAEVGDFLLASLKEPLTWGLALFAVGLVLADNAWSRRVQARGPSRFFRWYGSGSYRVVNYAVMIFMVGAFLFLYATFKYEWVMEGDGERVRVTLADGSSKNNVVLLDTTGRFLFLFDTDYNRVYIHPHESVLTIRKAAPPRDNKSD